MGPISAAKVLELQLLPSNIRNVCILAHVDHGKTTLSDSLLASNGIISAKMAGKARYLDSREDEQERGITMESSAISLYFRILRHKGKDGDQHDELKEYLINLIDSPGHIDFSSEVSTASRLCDGALVLVDVVEGVCSQTITVLRQAWVDKIKPILVFNKIDRLITEMKFTPNEAYIHLSKLLEQVNAIMGTFFAGDVMEQDLRWRESNQEAQYIEKSDDDIYFAPERNNIIFASAIDGWGFTVAQFASIYERKLGMNRQVLELALWGDYYLDPKAKKVISSKSLKGRNLKPLFVQLVLDNIWAVYNSTVIDRDPEKTDKIVKALNVKILPRDLRSKDTKALLHSIFSQWLPLSSAILLTVTQYIPDPSHAQRITLENIIENAPGGNQIPENLHEAMKTCDANGPLSVFVSKIVAVPEEDLPKNKRIQLSVDEMREMGRAARESAAKAAALEAGGGLSEDGQDINVNNDDDDPFDSLQDDSKQKAAEKGPEKLIGFSRIYSGTLKVGQEVYVLGPKYDPNIPGKHITKTTITDLFLFMGRELISLDTVPAGNIVGIGGLEGKVLKNGTISSTSECVNLAGVSLAAAPIVRVAIEPEDPTQMRQLENGLRLLHQADPCVEVMIQESGEHIMLTAGELHLERCLKDLRERFANIEIQSSEPIVPYRESIVSAADMNPPKNPSLGRGVSIIPIANQSIALKVLIRPLPRQVTDYLINHKNTITWIQSLRKEPVDDDDDQLVTTGEGQDRGVATGEERLLSQYEFKTQLDDLFKKFSSAGSRDLWNLDNICAFGPRRTGPNLLIDNSDIIARHALRESNNSDPSKVEFNILRAYQDSIVSGFQLSTSQGPLCGEPTQGIAVVIEGISLSLENYEGTGITGECGNAGHMISAIRESFRYGFLDWSPRLLLAMYSCDIQASTDVLGKVYGVVTRRRGRIIAEEMNEGTPFFTIKALIPVVEAFGFADEIRKRTSGAASPQLIFSGFEMLNLDPFWVPTTEEELEDLGDIADKENLSRKYMEAVRKRKGLFIEQKIVANAEKQRTLKK